MSLPLYEAMTPLYEYTILWGGVDRGHSQVVEAVHPFPWHGHLDPMSHADFAVGDPGHGDVAVQGVGTLVVGVQDRVADESDGAGEVYCLDLGCYIVR